MLESFKYPSKQTQNFKCIQDFLFFSQLKPVFLFSGLPDVGMKHMRSLLRKPRYI